MHFLFKQVSQEISPVDESSSEPLVELLGESGDINQVDSYGRTVLHTLAADGNASLLELALSACPQVHICFELFYTRREIREKNPAKIKRIF